MTNTIAVLDACVLYPAPVRDLLLSLASENLFEPRWSAIIQDEWVRNLLRKRPDLTENQLVKAVKAMNSAFPLANVSGFQKYIPSIILPDEDDRHVVACAIQSRATKLVTFNTKDFPESILANYAIEVISPDQFITQLISLEPALCGSAFQKMHHRLKNPPIPKETLLAIFQKCGLQDTALALAKVS